MTNPIGITKNPDMTVSKLEWDLESIREYLQWARWKRQNGDPNYGKGILPWGEALDNWITTIENALKVVQEYDQSKLPKAFPDLTPK